MIKIGPAIWRGLLFEIHLCMEMSEFSILRQYAPSGHVGVGFSYGEEQ